jgi:hypothetical protein
MYRYESQGNRVSAGEWLKQHTQMKAPWDGGIETVDVKHGKYTA